MGESIIIEEDFDYKSIKSLVKTDDIKALYQIGKSIGEGSYGEVREVVHLKLNIKCAMKIITKQKIFSTAYSNRNLEREL